MTMPSPIISKENPGSAGRVMFVGAGRKPAAPKRTKKRPASMPKPEIQGRTGRKASTWMKQVSHRHSTERPKGITGTKKRW